MTLFKQQYVEDAWVEQREAMERKCIEVSDDEVLTSSLEELSQQIAKPYHFDIPDVLVDQLSRDEPVFTRDSDKRISSGISRFAAIGESLDISTGAVLCCPSTT